MSGEKIEDVKFIYEITNQRGEPLSISVDDIVEKAALYLENYDFKLSSDRGVNKYEAMQAIRRTLETYNPLIKTTDFEDQIIADATKVLEMFEKK